jgi:heptosyltransferase-2
MPETLIVRLPNWLGDTVMAVPALRALRRGHADARVALVGPWATLLAGQDLADELVPYPRSWAGRLARWDGLRALEASMAILLPNSMEAALAARYWRARRRVGFDAGGRGWLLTDPVPTPVPRGHQVDQYLLLIERFGVSVGVGARTPRLAVPPPESPARATARELLRDAGAVGEGRRAVVGIQLGAAYGPSKLWTPARIAELCRGLRDAAGVPVLLGARTDVAIARRLVDETGVASVVGRDSPELLTAILAELDALVCGDTGVGHLAAALGTPVVALFGPTDPALTAPRGPVRVITHRVPCAPCFYRACPIDHPCLDGVGAEEVRRALDGALASTRPGVCR